ncbi:two-component system, OmpR family, phosphate regulon sensor histidine kinase PhoR [Desulfuromusa kysingii]|uniref:histidine kinase n=1 Tax=Desulfuromusa kysingii TaxID=37625 RepID=A0A1H3W5L9_9BACT|nr:ATP-binding protein [Desulfuromusa kysingii]SDZ82395.1 two-component system, OmpR family, phosphate regulon sensor histidine kinase PhoR [Desulfuromusa kysingii]
MKLHRRRLIWQLYPSYLILIFVVLLVVGWSLSGMLRSFHYQQVEDDLRARAELVEPQLQGHLTMGDQDLLLPVVTRLGEQSGTRITVIMRDGRVLVDSDEDPRLMDNHGQRTEVVEALAGQQGTSIRFSNTLGESLMYVAIPVYDGEQITVVIRTALPLSAVDETLQEIYWQLFLAGLIIGALLAPVCWWLSRRISRPLELMTAGAQKFSQGLLAIPLAVTGSEETSRLAETMNLMAAKLADRIEQEIGQRAEIETVLGCMIEGIIAVDNDEQIIRLNRAAAELFNVPQQSNAGRPIQEVIRQAELQRFIQQALSQPEPLESELVMYGSEKRYLHVQATPLTGKEDSRIGVLIVLHDLTRLRRLESVRRDFVANVSHELKTPITAIRGAVETLLDDESTDVASQRFLQIIFKQSERLNALVEDLLNLSRIEQGVETGGWELSCEPLLPILHSARAACESLLSQQQVGLDIICPEQLKNRVNAPLLEQAIINLLTNAIKYSEAGSHVLIEVIELDEFVKIRVEDSGCGIAAEHLPRLFERFYRADLARSRSLGGTGLGLAIVKHVAHAHQGEITVSSEVGKGSCFTLLLPRRQKPEVV